MCLLRTMSSGDSSVQNWFNFSLPPQDVVVYGEASTTSGMDYGTVITHVSLVKYQLSTVSETGRNDEKHQIDRGKWGQRIGVRSIQPAGEVITFRGDRSLRVHKSVSRPDPCTRIIWRGGPRSPEGGRCRWSNGAGRTGQRAPSTRRRGWSRSRRCHLATPRPPEP
jgi:hypothetical protein